MAKKLIVYYYFSTCIAQAQRMKEGKIFEGTWFLPSGKRTEPHRFHGTLTFDPDKGTVLEIRINQINHPDLLQSIDILLGNTSEGPVTLYKCVCYLHHFGRGAVYYYHVQFIFDGGHLVQESHFHFSKIVAELQGLNEWITQKGIKIKSKDYRTGFKIDYKLPEKILFRISESLSGYFIFHVQGLKFGSDQLEVRLNQSTEIVLETSDLLTLDKMLEQMQIFSCFLMLGLDNITFATKVILYSNVHIETYARGTRIRRVPFRLLYPRPAGADINYVHQPRRMFFTHHVVKSRLESLLAEWFKLYQRNDAPLSLFFRQYSAKNKVDSTLFLNLAQVAEAYHGEMRRGRKRKEDAAYSQMKRDILTVFSKELPHYSEWMSEQFNRSSPMTLSDRLSELVNATKGTDLYSAIGDVEKFVRDAKVNRNYYTHYNKSIKKKAFSNSELYVLTSRLNVLIVFHIMVDLGFKKKDIAGRIMQFFHVPSY